MGGESQSGKEPFRGVEKKTFVQLGVVYHDKGGQKGLRREAGGKKDTKGQ